MNLKQLPAVALLAGLAACGATSAAQTAPGPMPSCSTWTAPSGAVNVLRLHQNSYGATFTGTVAAGGLTARLYGSTEAGGKFTGTAVVGSGIKLRIYGVYTSKNVDFHGRQGTDVYSTSHRCPS